MLYLYHFVPKEMKGSILYPLNELKNIFPDIYEKAVRKYKGRENILQDKIPTLNCLWNDVLHFTAIHPEKIKQVLSQLGEERTFECFEIDPHLLEPQKTRVLLYKNRDKELFLNEDNFDTYNPDTISQYGDLPLATEEYYRSQLAIGKRPLLFHLVPHILYKGSLDTGSLKKVRV